MINNIKLSKIIIVSLIRTVYFLGLKAENTAVTKAGHAHGGRITGGALKLHQLRSVGACVSYVWQSLSDITEQLLVGHQSGSQ